MVPLHAAVFIWNTTVPIISFLCLSKKEKEKMVFFGSLKITLESEFF
jgi:hypothetical protein